MKIFVCFFVILSQCCFAQNPKPFKTCSKNIHYAVDDWVLRKKAGMDLSIPLSNARYAGGAEALLNDFNAHSIDESIYTFRTAIYFVVNCKGQIGNFQIVDDVHDDLVNQVFEVVKKMPQKWKPAISKEGKAVDSYQVITLTVKSSKIIDVQYK